jgi:transcriptional regulator with XRE-family HTH domain
MAISTRRLIDQMAATSEERESNGEFLFNGAGEIIAKQRKALGLSLEDVAQRMHLNKSTILRYEKNEVPLSDYAVGRFAEIFDVDAEALMRECLKKVLPGMQESPLSKLLDQIV